MRTLENWIGEAGAKALFDGVLAQLLKKGFIAPGGQLLDGLGAGPPSRTTAEPKGH